MKAPQVYEGADSKDRAGKQGARSWEKNQNNGANWKGWACRAHAATAMADMAAAAVGKGRLHGAGAVE